MTADSDESRPAIPPEVALMRALNRTRQQQFLMSPAPAIRHAMRAMRLVLTSCLLAVSHPGVTSEVPPPPASSVKRTASANRLPAIAPEVFARPAAYTGMQLSPLGRQAVGRSIVNGKEYLVVLDLQTGKARAIALPLQVDLRRFGWADKHRVLFSFGASVREVDDEVYANRLMAHDLRVAYLSC